MTTPLSNHEQKIIAELELQFLDVGTPAHSPSAVAAPEQERRRYWSRRHHAFTGVLLALAGAVLMAIGATSSSIPAGAAGFVLMGTGAYLAMLSAVAPRQKKTKEPAGPEAMADTPGAGKMTDTGQGSFHGGHREMALWSLFFWL